MDQLGAPGTSSLTGVCPRERGERGNGKRRRERGGGCVLLCQCLCWWLNGWVWAGASLVVPLVVMEGEEGEGVVEVSGVGGWEVLE